MLKITQAMGLFARFRQLDTEMPLAQAQCLLIIADNEGLSLQEMAKKAGVGMSSASRYITQFSEIAARGEPGLGLVESREDPMERRKKIIRLTPRGKSVVSKLLGEK